MKARSFFVALALVFLAPKLCIIHAQTDSVEILQQALMPKEVYVGDEAQIRITFQSPVDFFALASPECITSDGISLDTTIDAFTQKEQSCTVVRAILERTEFSYTLIVTLIPWEPGDIDFAAFDLNSACHIEQGEIRANFIDIQNVTVTSLAKKLSATTLRNPASPKLLPGTNYILWAAIVGILIFLILMVLFFVHLPDFVKGFADFWEKIGFVRNAGGSKRQIKKLLAKKETDAQFAEEWQHIMRRYLEYRFSVKFNSIATNRIYDTIRTTTGDLLSADRDIAVEEMHSLCIRTDYIRYAGGSLEGQSAEFSLGEKKELVEKTLLLIDALEKEEESK